jgi:chromosome segregation ATPase
MGKFGSISSKQPIQTVSLPLAKQEPIIVEKIVEKEVIVEKPVIREVVIEDVSKINELKLAMDELNKKHSEANERNSDLSIVIKNKEDRLNDLRKELDELKIEHDKLDKVKKAHFARVKLQSEEILRMGCDISALNEINENLKKSVIEHMERQVQLIKKQKTVLYISLIISAMVGLLIGRLI